MSTLTVVSYADTKMVNVLQQSVVNNINNNNNNNNSNSFVDGNNSRDIIIYRKTQQSEVNDILLTNAVKSINNNNNSSGGNKKQSAARSKQVRMQNPPPIAVARRNARERNRVKQVNNGFATLRQHIPSSITAAYENNGRGANKKLSKVETLRMAVEYIRRLEDMLAISSKDDKGDGQVDSFNYHPSTVSCQINLSYSNVDEEKYGKLSRSNGFQLINSRLYEDEENIHPNIKLEEDILESNLIDADIDMSEQFLHSMHSSGSLSPELTSEHSMSPRTDEKPLYFTTLDAAGISRLTANPLDDLGDDIHDVRDHPSDSSSDVMLDHTWWNREQMKTEER